MRSARRQCESNIYHVLSRGTGRQLIFEDDSDRELFLSLLKSLAQDRSVDVLAWCLMGNHFHLLLHAPMDVISLLMKDLCGRYAQQFNSRHDRVGHLFQERFKSEPVEHEAYLAVVVCYIHFNPEKAGMASFDKYPWSSYAEYSGAKGARDICSTELIMGYFDGVDNLKQFHVSRAADATCLDVDRSRLATRSMRDEDAMHLAKEALGGLALSEVKAQQHDVRNNALRKLRASGLSVRQIERLTGISRGVIQDIKADAKADK